MGDLEETVQLPRLLTYEEAANYLRISVRTLRRLVSSREIPTVEIRGRRLFDTKDLKKYLQAQKSRQPGGR